MEKPLTDPSAFDSDAAHTFIREHARPVEQAVHAVLFGNGDPSAVVDSLLPYRNDDGGFGHGLEPDKQVPDSQALDVEIAFERMATAGALAPEVLAPACDWLATIADDRGAVPILMPNSNRPPRAAHWNAAAYLPALNPTAAIAGHAHAIGVMHPSLAGHSRPVSPVIGASCVKKFKPS